MSPKTNALTFRIKTTTAACAIGAGIVVLAACSSGSSASSAPSSAPSSASTGSSGSASAAAASSAVSSDVQQTLSEFSKEPTLGLTPLASKPAPGKKLIYLDNSAAPTTITNGKAVAAAAAVLGWTTSTISYAGDPASLAQAVTQAVGDKPSAIILSGEDQSAFASALKAAGQAGVPVFDGGVPDVPTGAAAGGLTGVSLGPVFLQTEGKIAADWIIKASGGDADVAIVTLPDFNTLVVEDSGFTQEMKAQCPKCTVSTINAQITQIGNGLPQLVVSALQANPKIGYLFYPYGDMSIGVPPALTAAHIKVNSIASTASTGTYADLKAGTMVMNLTASTEVQGWLEVDLVARYFATHKPVIDNQVPIQILDGTDSSSPTLPLTPTNYQAQFEKAWQVG
jgi:ribose transport system substrate-binding protein